MSSVKVLPSMNYLQLIIMTLNCTCSCHSAWIYEENYRKLLYLLLPQVKFLKYWYVVNNINFLLCVNILSKTMEGNSVSLYLNVIVLISE